MKLTYAQKVEIAQKAIKVCDSVKRSSQVDIASEYTDIALTAIGVNDNELRLKVKFHQKSMETRIDGKPRYKYNHSTSEWVRSLTLDERFDAFHSRYLDQAIASQSSPSNHMDALSQERMLNNHKQPYWFGQGAQGLPNYCALGGIGY